MSKLKVLGLVLLAAGGVAAAEVPAVLPFDESLVCREERSSAQFAASRATPAPDDAAAVARVDRARRDLAAAKKGRERYQQWLDEALADLEGVRAAWRKSAATRDAAAAALAACLERARGAHQARESARIAEEERRSAKEAARRQRLSLALSSGTAVRIALSALVCSEEAARDAALREIAAEKKLARVGGVWDKKKVYELQQEARDADERKVSHLGELKSRKWKAVRCSDAAVKQVLACLPDPTPAAERDPSTPCGSDAAVAADAIGSELGSEL